MTPSTRLPDNRVYATRLELHIYLTRTVNSVAFFKIYSRIFFADTTITTTILSRIDNSASTPRKSKLPDEIR